MPRSRWRLREMSHALLFGSIAHINTPTRYIDLMLSMVTKTVSRMMAPWPHFTYPSLMIWSWPSSLSPIVIIPSRWRGEFWDEEKGSPAECMVVYQSSFDFQNAEVASSATACFIVVPKYSSTFRMFVMSRLSLPNFLFDWHVIFLECPQAINSTLFSVYCFVCDTLIVFVDLEGPLLTNVR